MRIIATSFKRSHACTATLSAPNPAAGRHQPPPPLETSGHSQASLGQSPMVSLLPSPEDLPNPGIKPRSRAFFKSRVIKGLHDPDNHDGVITHLELDIQECEVKWVLGSITTKKASGGDGIPVELFQILKNDAVKVLHPICQQI